MPRKPLMATAPQGTLWQGRGDVANMPPERLPGEGGFDFSVYFPAMNIYHDEIPKTKIWEPQTK